MRILLPVDGSEGSVKAARHIVVIAAHVPELEVHLINVQPPGDDWMVRRMIKAEELAAMEREWGESAMAPARAILQATGLRMIEHIVQGDVAASIVAMASDQGCDQIVMGSHGRTALGGMLLGSVAMKVLHLSKTPVTFVKE